MKIFLQKHKLIILIVLLAFSVRMYRITNPIADWHSWRQADTASVTQEYVKNGIDILRPTYHDMSNIPSGEFNPEGYRMVEFPFINAMIAAPIRALPFLDLVITSRVVSVIFSLGALISLYFLVKDISDKKTALLTALIFSIMPYSIYYSRVILPEPFMLFFSTFSLFTFNRWLNKDKWSYYFLSLISLSLALLLKPFVVFLAPVYLTLAIIKDGKNIFKRIGLYPFALAVVPFFLWRDWIQDFPTGIPDSDWLFNSNKIRLQPAWFRWLGYERLTKLMLGFFGLIFIPFNLLKINKDFYVYASWWLGILAYLIVMATGNVQHDYYQVILIPIVSISVARGITILHEFLSKKLNKRTSFIIIVLISVLALLFSWNEVKGYFNVNHWEYIHVGEMVDQSIPKNAVIIAPDMGNTVFLFQTNRKGWPIGFDIDEKIKKGAEYYVTTSYADEAHELEEKYETVTNTMLTGTKDTSYLLLNLTKPLSKSLESSPSIDDTKEEGEIGIDL